jgi:DNA-binding transcriptional MerR regulator
MAHEIAKILLEHAETFLGRTEAIETALSLGMPLQEIESYLDWLDNMQAGRKTSEHTEEPPSQEDNGTEAS